MPPEPEKTILHVPGPDGESVSPRGPTVTDRESAPREPFGPEPKLGQLVANRYLLEKRLGAGGFGAVFAAADTNVGKSVAIKILHAAFVDNTEAVSRFRREVDCIAQIRHPNVIAVTDYGVDSVAGHYLVMPLVKGGSLHDLMSERRLDMTELHLIVRQILEALEAAHDLGVVHQDLKPENIMLVESRKRAGSSDVLLLDFGIAKVADQLLDKSKRGVLGTPGWMSPEQITQQPTDARSDLYSLGVLLYWLLTGNAPIAADTPVEMMKRHVMMLPRPPSATDGGAWLPPALDSLVLDLLAKDPRYRPQTAQDVLDRWLAAQPEAVEAWALRLVCGHAAAPLSPRTAENTVLTPAGQAVVAQGWSEIGPSGMVEEARSEDGVLIVDDEEGMRFLLRSLVQAVGWPCWTVASVDEAIAWIQERGHPRVLVTDLMMPRATAFDMLSALDVLGYQGGRVVCTSVSSGPVRETAERQGAFFVNKATELYKLPDILQQFRPAN